jgi:aminopeptidase N
VPSLGRGYSAPVRVEFDYDEPALSLLAAHDSDPVNRWDAAQRMFTLAIRAIAAEQRGGRSASLTQGLVDVIAALLDDHARDPALIALALSPPDPAYVASLDAVIDVDGIDNARSLVVRELARALPDRFERVYHAQRRTGRYEPTPAQMAQRRLANVCLRYLAERGDAAGRAFAVEQYETADNMTEAVGALGALADATSPERDDLYARFEERWRDEPLVLDKWFALEATSRRPGTLMRVRQLLGHPRFNVRNPNRVRSLVGAFALRNFARFHAADGSGYAFVADQVLALDPMNPQLAARIAGAFELWKRFDEPRRGRASIELKRIAGAPALSPDVTEIVTRSLAD